MEPPAAADRPSYRRVLRRRPFLWLWLAQLISQSGDFVFAVALLWLVLEATGSVVAVTIVFTATIAPGVVVGPLLGVYVDRWDRRRTLIAVNVAEGLLVAVLSTLVLTHAIDVAAIVAIVLALGAGASIVRGATNALVPQLVGATDLAPANALTTLSGSFNQIVGYSVGGLVVALVGPALPIEYDALSFFVAALMVAAIDVTVGRPADASPSEGFGREFAEGWRFLRSEPALIELLVLGMVVNFFGNAVFALFAPYARFVLSAGAAGYGLLSAAIAAGGAVGALAMGRTDTRRSAGRFVLVGGFTIGAGVAGFGLVRVLPEALGVAVALGAVLSVTNLPISILFQAKVPGRLLGRVGAVATGFLMAAGPFGSFLAGPFAERLTIPTFYVFSGILISAVMALGLVVMRKLRDVRYGELA